MDGIIIESPFAKMIINGDKKYDFRKIKPPSDKLGTPLYLITDNQIFGEIMITNCNYNQIKHMFCWEFVIMKKYNKPKKILKLTKNGNWGNEIKIG